MPLPVLPHITMPTSLPDVRQQLTAPLENAAVRTPWALQSDDELQQALSAVLEMATLNPAGYLQLPSAPVAALIRHGGPGLVAPLRAELQKAPETVINPLRLAATFWVAQQFIEAPRLLPLGDDAAATALVADALRWSRYDEPLVAIYLSGFLRAANRQHVHPETYGPLAGMLIRQASQPPGPHTLDPLEEVGGTLAQLQAQMTARETVRQLAPYLLPL